MLGDYSEACTRPDRPWHHPPDRSSYLGITTMIFGRAESLSQVSREHLARQPCANAASHKTPGRWLVHAISPELAEWTHTHERKFEKWL